MPPSIVWQFFKKAKIGGTCNCTLCNVVVPTKGNTTNLWAHLRQKHYEIYISWSKKKHKPVLKRGNKLNSAQSTNHEENEQSDVDDPPPIEVEVTDEIADRNNVNNDSPGCKFQRSDPKYKSTPARLQGNVEKKRKSEILKYFTSTTSLASDEKVDVEMGDSSGPSSTKSENFLAQSNSSLSSGGQLEIPEAFDKLESMKEGGAKHSKITNAIIYMIAKDHQPLNLTEKPGFSYLMKTVAPRFKLFKNGKTVTLMEDKYMTLSKLLKIKLKKAGDIALTADLWTEKMNVRPFLGLTAHYLEDGKLKKSTLGVFEFDERHSAENIQDFMEKALNEWGIEISNVVCIVTDGASNIVSASKSLFGAEKHFYCFAHVLNRVVVCSLLGKNLIKKNQPEKNLEGLEDFDDEGKYIEKMSSEDHINFQKLVMKIKKIITWFHQSNLGADDLRKISPLTLIQSCRTRWNSMFHMLQRYSKLSEVVAGILMRHPKAPPIVTPQEMEIVNDILPLLQIFDDITEDISGDSYVTISRVISFVDYINSKLDNIKPRTKEGIKIKESIVFEVEKRLFPIERSQIASCATILDPRYKRLHFQNPLNAANAVQKISQECEKMASEAEKKFQKELTKEIEKKDRLSSLGSFTASKAKFSNMGKEMNQTEISRYLEESTIAPEMDPLEYWNQNKHIYPKLYKLAMKYLLVPATSTPSERLFSQAGNIMLDKRNRLSPEHLNQLLFLNSLSFEDWHLD